MSAANAELQFSISRIRESMAKLSLYITKSLKFLLPSI